MGLSLTRKYEKLITRDFVNMIESASKLHDIGKMAISDKILQKEGHLTEHERRIMMSHTTVGVETLRKIYSDNTDNGFIRMAMDIAYYHHEKWDGTGYPCGLKGTEIPLAARIMAVVDAYDALVNERSYKPPYSHIGSINIIKGEAGKSFDPDVVDILCRLERKLKRGNPADQASDHRGRGKDGPQDDRKTRTGGHEGRNTAESYEAMEGRR